MFAHTIDIACVNAWIEYKKKASQLNVPKNRMLYFFRINVVEILTKRNKPATRKRASLLLLKWE